MDILFSFYIIQIILWVLCSSQLSTQLLWQQFATTWTEFTKLEWSYIPQVLVTIKFQWFRINIHGTGLLYNFITWQESKPAEPMRLQDRLWLPRNRLWWCPHKTAKSKTNVLKHRSIRLEIRLKEYKLLHCKLELWRMVHTISVASTLVPIIFSLTSHSFWILTCTNYWKH